MGWFGLVRELNYALSVVHADKDENGKFLIYGKQGPCVGLGGDEIVIDDDLCYSVDGNKKTLASLMNSTSYGCRGIVVI